MIDNGAKTAFDIWYEWDKDKFTSSEKFTRTLKYVKDNNMDITKK